MEAPRKDSLVPGFLVGRDGRPRVPPAWTSCLRAPVGVGGAGQPALSLTFMRTPSETTQEDRPGNGNEAPRRRSPRWGSPAVPWAAPC